MDLDFLVSYIHLKDDYIHIFYTLSCVLSMFSCIIVCFCDDIKQVCRGSLNVEKKNHVRSSELLMPYLRSVP